MVSLDKGLQHLEETGEDLVSIIKSSNAESIARAVVEKRQQLFDLLINTRKTTSQLLNDMMRTEELVGQKLLDTEARKSEAARELESLQQELERYQARKHTMEAELQFLQGELESLQNSEVEIEALQQEVDEDTTEVIPSAIYLAQLYHKVTKIKWEYGTEPGILKGVHYGDDLATPINIDTTSQSKVAISSYLWSFVSTEW
ncbi:kinetochore protein Spc24 isoform X1 [Brienomyrus brachyistius]|uniref:kinetochore protein Spc24 isoform X1 n=1 Tax=Brienomyrus brachyistius TaxID=42636 RepID=UPI0020B17CBD|nr:kinetochore protein Spc24 isoform X1 [Brienomyrus brachyistius]